MAYREAPAEGPLDVPCDRLLGKGFGACGLLGNVAFKVEGADSFKGVGLGGGPLEAGWCEPCVLGGVAVE